MKETLTDKGREFYAALEKAGVQPEKLCVLMVGASDQIVGEIELLKIGEPVVVRNPKRLSRIQQVHNGPNGAVGMSIMFMVGDLDLMEEGVAQFLPTGGYLIRWGNPASITSMLGLYAEFLERREQNKKMAAAKDAGIVLPNGPLPRGGRS
jgi:hypothetical protein